MSGIISKDEILEVMFRHKLKIILLPLFIMAASILVVLFFPRQYRSEAKLYLQIGRESLGIDPTATMGSSTALVQSNREEEVKSALQVIGSRGVISQVVDKLSPDYVLEGVDPNDPPPGSTNVLTAAINQSLGQVLGAFKAIDPVSAREEAEIEIEQSLKVEAERNSMVISASYDAKTPQAAQRVLDTLIEIYQADHLRIHRNRQTGNFLLEQRDMLLAKYTNAQEKVKNTKNEFGISSIVGRRSSLENRLQSIELEKNQNTQNLATSRAKSVDLRTQLVSLPERETSSTKSVPNAGVDLLRRELYTSQIRMLDLKSRLAENHPQLIATNKQVEDAQRMVDAHENDRKETVDDINPIYRALSLELRQQDSIVAGLVARQQELLSQHTELLTGLEDFNRQAIVLTQMEHDEQIARDKYLQYTNSLEQALSDEALENERISSVSVAQKATMAERPVSPSKLLVLVAGAMLSMASVFCLIFLSEKLNDRIRTEGDLSSLLGLPVLATIPDSTEHKRLLVR